MILSIQSIATFKAIEDYLQPKIEQAMLNEMRQKNKESNSKESGPIISPTLQRVPVRDVERNLSENELSDLDEDEIGVGDPEEEETSASVLLDMDEQNPSHSPAISNKLDTTSSASSGSKSISYAKAALTGMERNWQLVFRIGECVIDKTRPVYRAAHLLEEKMDQGSASSDVNIWANVYTVKFAKVSDEEIVAPYEPEPSPNLQNTNEKLFNVLELLKLIHALNNKWIYLCVPDGLNEVKDGPESLSEMKFVSSKLTGKVEQQLREPLIIASGLSSPWCRELIYKYPFLCPFATRSKFLQSTCLGYQRALSSWQKTRPNSKSGNLSRGDTSALGRISKHKIRIMRSKLLESAVKVMEGYASSPTMIEVEFADEVGSGLGPTLEFYSEVCKEFCRKDLKLWLRDTSHQDDTYIYHPTGLYPSPIPPSADTSEVSKRLKYFEILGLFVAKAIMDGRLLDMNFNSVFLSLLVGRSVEPSLRLLRAINPSWAKSAGLLTEFVEFKAQNPNQRTHCINNVSLEDMCISFSLPGDADYRFKVINLEPSQSNMAYFRLDGYSQRHRQPR